MNPVLILVVLVLFVFVIWVGRSGAASLAEFIRLRIRKLAGAGLLALAAYMALRGLWEPALAPAAFGWWLIAATGKSNPVSSILEKYMDGRFPGWRAHLQGDANPGSGRAHAGVSMMSEEEAYEILGLQPGESREAIAAAYRAAMKKVHPDQGGTGELAVRLNLARDVLLRSHI